MGANTSQPTAVYRLPKRCVVCVASPRQPTRSPMNTPLTSPLRLATRDARAAAGGAVALCTADEALLYRCVCLFGAFAAATFSRCTRRTGPAWTAQRPDTAPCRGIEALRDFQFSSRTARVEKSEQAVAQNSTGPPNEAAGRKLPSAGNCVSKEKETQMLDTSSQANFKPTAEIDDLDVLAKAIREHLQASANAAQNYLDHMLDVGDALIRAKAQVKHGEWLPWLKLCDLNEDKAERYMKLARHRAELNSAGVRNLSLSAALKLIAKKKPVDGPRQKSLGPSLTSTRSCGGQAPLQKLDPASLTVWGSNRCLRRSRQAGGWKRSRRSNQFLLASTSQFRAALSATSAREAFNYLTPVRRALAAYPIHDVEICLKTKITDSVAPLEFAFIWKRT